MASSEEIRALAERMAAAFASQISTSERVGRVIRNIPPIGKTASPPKKQIPDSAQAFNSDGDVRKPGRIDIRSEKLPAKKVDFTAAAPLKKSTFN